MYIPLLIVLAGCPQPTIKNQSEYRWNRLDDEEVTYAEQRCQELYDDAPCLKYFYKINENDYKVTCGAKTK